ncbi:hypothetical protein C7382_10225 [Porphyromonas loveana]|uniref:Uncharacterized protein n=1 Tax=Porphyromonas loveana TaxID=1884669 RepID=A0A2U1FPA7_9PORP|nr:hypothetical protein C7382_10225 [Porphyromonas loveana]
MGRSRRYGVSQKTCKAFVCGFEEKPGENTSVVVSDFYFHQDPFSFPNQSPEENLCFRRSGNDPILFARNWSVL